VDVDSIALWIADALRGVLAVEETASVAVSSGPLLLAVLPALAMLEIPWARVRFLMVDDLPVPPSDPRSRYRQVYEAFFSKLGLRPGHVLRYWSEGDPPEAVAGYYGQMVAEVLEVPPGDLPRLDLVLLELAPDGAVGAFAPDSTAAEPGGGFARTVEAAGQLRYTITGDTIRRAGKVAILGTGGLERSPVVEALRPASGELHRLSVSETRSPGAASQR
jgi:6-phosphogluconolactonase/glucosamine-6-phosphate isomerase/deaminase